MFDIDKTKEVAGQARQVWNSQSMRSQRGIARFPIFQLLIAVSLLVGWFVPGYYDWTGSDQSRPSPLVWQTALGLIVGAIIIWAALPWIRVADEVPGTDQWVQVRFTSRAMFLMTAAVAFVIVAVTKFPMVVSGGLCAFAFCYVVWFWSRYRQHRWQTTALMACIWFPFVWIIAWDDFENIFPAILWIAGGMPAFVPAILIGKLFGQNPHDVMWLGVLLTGAEMTVGTWIIRLGPRRTMAYLVFVLLMSTFGSFGLNSLIRA
jgi:hypothetical protein